MRVIRLLIAAGLSAGAAGLAPTVAVAATVPQAQLTSFVCQRAVDPAFRAMSVTAVMRPLTGTRAMRLRFTLLEARALHGHYRVVPGHNLGRWLAPNPPNLGQEPGDVWEVPHPVAPLLSAPAFYRLQVAFRWLGPDGKRLDQVVELSPVCHQVERRPDLLVQGILVTPASGNPAQSDYVAVIRNRGLTGAGPFAVTLTPPGGATITKTINWLGSHHTRRLKFAGPACAAGSTVTVVADPTDQVSDFDRANNTLTLPCPATTTG